MNSIQIKDCDKDRLKLFIFIVIELLNAEIKFPRAGAKPLICKQCLLIKGTFKEYCNNFISIFGREINILWTSPEIKPTSYQSNPKRAQEACRSFIHCLNQIVKQLGYL